MQNKPYFFSHKHGVPNLGEGWDPWLGKNSHIFPFLLLLQTSLTSGISYIHSAHWFQYCHSVLIKGYLEKLSNISIAKQKLIPTVKIMPLKKTFSWFSISSASRPLQVFDTREAKKSSVKIYESHLLAAWKKMIYYIFGIVVHSLNNLKNIMTKL